MQQHHNWLLFAVPVEKDTEWERDIFVRLWNCYISDKMEIFYLVINSGSRALFSRNRYLDNQETLFYFTLMLVQIVPKGTSPTNGEYWFMSWEEELASMSRKKLAVNAFHKGIVTEGWPSLTPHLCYILQLTHLSLNSEPFITLFPPSKPEAECIRDPDPCHGQLFSLKSCIFIVVWKQLYLLGGTWNAHNAKMHIHLQAPFCNQYLLLTLFLLLC